VLVGCQKGLSKAAFSYMAKHLLIADFCECMFHVLFLKYLSINALYIMTLSLSSGTTVKYRTRLYLSKSRGFQLQFCCVTLDVSSFISHRCKSKCHGLVVIGPVNFVLLLHNNVAYIHVLMLCKGPNIVIRHIIIFKTRFFRVCFRD